MKAIEAGLGVPLGRRKMLGTILLTGAACAAPSVFARPASGETLIFRGIRYAAADRYAPAELLPFNESLIQVERGPVAPQHSSRLAISLGPQAALRQDENCQVLSVFTPSRSGRRPVIVFIHGGASVTGGGELPWYDGDLLAREQDVVVVSITYRLGALGFWQADGAKGPSPATTDQLEALRWVQANIDRFGGDPDNVTVAGQSAGASAAMVLAGWGHSGTLFKRVIFMSSFRPNRDTTLAGVASREFDAVLGEDPYKASVAALLAAQARTGPAKPEGFWRIAVPAEIAPFKADFMGGWTSEELSAHMLLAEGKSPEPGASLKRFHPGTQPLAEGCKSLAKHIAALGCTAYTYSFDWRGPDTGLGNCHCIDLSFIFGDRKAWEPAPMLAGVDWADHDRLARSMRSQWASFARNGDPGSGGGPNWTPASATAAPVMSLR